MNFKNIILSILFVSFVSVLHSNAQIKYGLYTGVNFTGESTNIQNIRGLPIDQGGVNLMGGIHANKALVGNFEAELGLNFFTKGYTYEKNGEYNIPYDYFNTMKTISVPLTIFYNFVGKDDFDNLIGDLKLAVGGGLYSSYMLNGAIADEQGNVANAEFSNTNRLDYGARIMIKTLIGNHFECVVVKEFGISNTIKTGSGILKQNSLLFCIGYQF